MTGLLDTLDAQLEELFRGWNILSAVLALLLVGLLAYPLISLVEPDTHPLLLNRQSTVSPIRQPGESAIYRSQELSYDSPLKTGLNVRDPGTPKWHSGRDGDLRDIWRKAAGLVTDEDSKSSGQTGKILSIYGRENVVQHDFETLSKHINVIGQQIRKSGGTSVAIYLPNSVELLVAIFAGAFYGFTPILIPYEQPAETVFKLLSLAKADFLITTAGRLPAEDVKQQCRGIRHTILIVEPSSRDMDWSEDASSQAVWHELVEGTNDVASELPAGDAASAPVGITTLWLEQSPQSGELVTFTQSNIVAAVAAQLSALHQRHRLNNNDLFLPADALTSSPTLVLTLAALYSNVSIALNSVAGPEVELPLAATGIRPTFIAASAESASNLHTTMKAKVTGTAKKWALSSQMSALKAGVMPSKGLLHRVNPPAMVTLGKEPSKLRLLYVFERSSAGSPPFTSTQLTELRAFTGARVIYALTTAKVAGTVAQSNLFDYRIFSEEEKKNASFGAPVTSVELKVVDKKDYKTVEGNAIGELVVSGPAVLDGNANLGVIATFRDDSTLAFPSY